MTRIFDGKRPVVVMIDSVHPRPDRDSGSIDAMNYIRMFQDLGYAVAFIADGEFHRDVPAGETLLEQQGVCRIKPPIPASVTEFIRKAGKRIDLFFLSRVNAGGKYLEQILCHSRARIIFNTVDLHFVREERHAALRRDRAALDAASATRERELHLCRLAHVTLVVSETEKALLEHAVPGARIVQVPLVRDCPGRKAPFGRRSGIGFIGGFLHSPNVDAVTAFLAEAWPLVRASLPDAELHIMGADMPQAFVELRQPGVVSVGYVDDLAATLERLRLTVAPLRYGAGAKGKVVTSLAHGLPCVATPIAAEGMGLTDGENILIGRSAGELAAGIVRVHEDEALWTGLSDRGIETVRSKHSYGTGRQVLREALSAIGAALP